MGVPAGSTTGVPHGALAADRADRSRDTASAAQDYSLLASQLAEHKPATSADIAALGDQISGAFSAQARKLQMMDRQGR